eukprot:Sspe_Gene.16134::Locus_5671_Transcript_1_1_Confidence_1.000_Length_2197::g.16134::m.16134/K03514/PAPD5_7, TRF4; non-canonical poly(A) RNA polymerase PAPD5/7
MAAPTAPPPGKFVGSGQPPRGGQARKPTPASGAKDPPWLLFARLPNDGSVSAADEIEAFSQFVSPTPIEKARKGALRAALQAMIQMSFPDATTKVCGSSAEGLDTFLSGLDLVVEIPSAPQQDPLETLRISLTNLGVENFMRNGTSGDYYLVIPAKSLTRLFRGWSDVAFSAYVRFRVGHSPERQSATIITNLFKSYPSHRKVITVAKAVLRQMNLVGDSGGIPSHSLTLMSIALFEHAKLSPSFTDCGWVLREFFRFYASFDFDNLSIWAGVPTPHCPSPFLPKVHTSDQLSILDLVDSTVNTAASTTKMPQIKAMFHYVTTCIQRFDRVGARSMLSNFVAHNDLWQRYDFLRNIAGGGEVTKDFAMDLMNTLAQVLADPQYESVRGRLAKAAEQDGGAMGEHTKQELVNFSSSLGLLEAHLSENPHSRLAPYRGKLPELANQVMKWRDTPEMHHTLNQLGLLRPVLENTSMGGTAPDASDAAGGETSPPQGWTPWGSSSPQRKEASSSSSSSSDEVSFTEEDAIGMIKGLADYLQDHPTSIEELSGMIEKDTTEDKVETKLHILSRIVEHRTQEKPNSRLAAFRDNIPLLAEKLFEHYDAPEMQAQLLRIITLNTVWAKFLNLRHVPELLERNVPEDVASQVLDSVTEGE